MGNEIYYCIACGIRVSGGLAAGDRSHCAVCLGVPVQPRREPSKRIRRGSSATMVAVAARPTIAEPPPRNQGSPLLLGAVCLAAVIAAGVSFRSPPPEKPRQSPATVVIAPAPSAEPQRPEPPPPPPPPSPTPAPSPVDVALESRADAAYDSIQEAASALADEGRFDDALARIRAFPEEFRRSRAWTSLEGLRRQIERRAR